VYSYLGRPASLSSSGRQREHDEHGYAEEPEVVYVRQHGGLSIEHICDDWHKLGVRLIGGGSFGLKRPRSLSKSWSGVVDFRGIRCSGWPDGTGYGGRALW